MNLKKSLRALWHQGIEIWLDQGQLRFNAAKASYTAFPTSVPTSSDTNTSSPVEQIKALINEHQTDILTILNDEPDLYRGFPLSQGQRSMVILQEMMPDSCACNLMGILELGEDLDIELLRRSVGILIERHPSLRTEFCHLEGEQAQRVLENVPIPLTVTTANNLSDAQIEEWVDAKSDVPFDLFDGPNFISHLLDNRNPNNKHNRFLLMILGFHTISDFIGMELLSSDLAGIYDSLKASEQPAPLSSDLTFKDYVFAESQALAGPRGEELWEYWQPQLSNLPSPIELPTDFPRPPRQSYTGKEYAFVIDEILAVAIKKLAMKLRVTPFVVVMVAHQILMQRYSNEDLIAIGIPMAARSAYDCNTVVGHFTNPVPLIVDLSANPQFSDLVASNLDLLKGGMAHQEYPFQGMIDKLKPEHDLSRPTLFQTALTWNQTNHKRHNIGEGCIVEDIRRSEQRGTLYDLVLNCYDTGKRTNCMINYNSDIFNEDRMARLSQHFLTLLRSIIANPKLPISELNILPPSERRLLVSFNDTERPYPADHSVAELFENQTANTPDAIALDFNGDKLTYTQLNDRANQVANQLQSMGINNGDFVGVCMERCNELLISILGIVKAGAAYVPMDVSYPDERLAFVLEDTEACVVISMLEHADRLTTIDLTIASPQILCLDRDANSIATQVKTRQTTLLTNYARQTACVLFTSGSTGRPKGVMVPHNALSRLSLNVNFFERCPGDVIAHVNNISFDAASWEIWGTLLNGACLKIIEKDVLLNPQEFEKYLRSGKLTALLTTTALFNLYATRDPAIYNNMKYVMLGGEALDPSIILQVKKAGGPQHLVNVYGPTENGTFSSTHDIKSLSDTATTVPIGIPNANSTVYILDKYRNPAPIGVAGEIYVGGPAVALGYLKHEDLSAEKFIKDPFTQNPDAMMYATGDIGRYLVDGVLEMVGRVDDQVKIRGFRIELGEIESAVGHHETVKDCAVIAVQPEGDGPKAGKKFVAAYVVANSPPIDDSEKAALCDTLRKDMRQLLPDYMVPSAFVILEDLPLTANGKINRSILPIPEKQTSSEYVAPRNELETQLTTLWTELLDVEKVGIYDDFFELGGHSLLATQLTSRIQDNLGFNISIRTIFEAPTCAALADKLSDGTGSASRLPPLTPIIPTEERPSTLLLSLAQQRLWFVEQLDPGNTTYVLPAALKIHGELNTEALERALNTLIDRHESLRTRFVESNHEAFQHIDKKEFQPLAIKDLSRLDKAETDKQLKTLTQDLVSTSFDITKGKLFRFTLIKLNNTVHVLLLSMHHIISDGWSVEVLLSELGLILQAYEAGKPNPLPPLVVQYADYSLWQREWLRDKILEDQQHYWCEQLADVPNLIKLPTDRPRPIIQSAEGAIYQFKIPKQTADALKQLGQKHQSTLFMVLMAAYSILIGRYSRQNDICIGFPISGRRTPELEKLIGLFVNNLVIRSDLETNNTLPQLLASVRKATLEAHDHSDIAFDSIIEALNMDRSLSHTPLLQVSFTLQSMSLEAEAGRLLGHEVELLDIDWVTSKYDLNLICYESKGDLTAEMEYRTDIFNASTIERMMAHFQNILAAMIANPHESIHQLNMLDETEHREILLNNFHSGYSKPQQTVPQLFEEQVEKNPDAIAVCCEQESLSYRELNHKSNQLARELQSRGIKIGDFVGLCLERSNDLLVGILGILKAGAAYVPLDPHFPADRLAFILEDSGAAVLVSSADQAKTLLGYTGECLLIDNDANTIEQHSIDNLSLNIPTSSTIYVLYTSGTTGKPKGCLVTHANVVRLFSATNNDYAFNNKDVWTLFHSYAFDFTVWEIWGALLYGGRLVIVPYLVSRSPEEFYQLLAEEQVTVLNQTPSAFSQLIAVDAEQNSQQDLALRYVVFGGEALDFNVLKTWTDRHGLESPQLINMYGITETTVHVTYYPITEKDINNGGSIIGRAIDDLHIYILDAQGQLVPNGVAGEMHISGLGVTDGYLKRDELSAEKFIPNHFIDSLPETSRSQHLRLYRSGDLARSTKSGDIEYLGRIDQQIKIRGFRIELGEIESILNTHPAIHEAIVHTHGEGNNLRLIAYMVLNTDSLDADELKGFLKNSLPDYMVPSFFIVLDNLPLTPNGKVDRKNLPLPEGDLTSSEYIAPRNNTEQLIADVWAEVLCFEKVGIHDNFFEIGGHSLLATQVISRIREKFDTELALRIIFESPTIAELALHLLKTELEDIDLGGEDIESLLDGLLDDDIDDEDLDDLLNSGTK